MYNTNKKVREANWLERVERDNKQVNKCELNEPHMASFIRAHRPGNIFLGIKSNS